MSPQGLFGTPNGVWYNKNCPTSPQRFICASTSIVQGGGSPARLWKSTICPNNWVRPVPKTALYFQMIGHTPVLHSTYAIPEILRHCWYDTVATFRRRLHSHQYILCDQGGFLLPRSAGDCHPQGFHSCVDSPVINSTPRRGE